MPHSVVQFLRTSSGGISQIKKAATARSSRNSSRNTSRAGSPYASDSEDHAPAVKLPDLADAVKKHHRLSLFGRSSKEAKEIKENPAFTSVALGWQLESPPIVFFNNPQESSGALVSGQMVLEVKEDSVEIDHFSASLSLNITQKRPSHAHCTDCQTKKVDLQVWKFLSQPTTLHRGKYMYPFSVLLDGTNPASMDTPLVSITYLFKAEASVIRHPNTASASYVPARFERTLDVKRSLAEPLYPHHSVRVFPPTNIKAGAHYNSIIHPTSTQQMTLKLDGLITHNEKVKTVDLWKLKKVTWRLEETTKTTAPYCDKHAPVASDEADETARKGVVRTDTRLLGEKHYHDGWKSDYTGNDGSVDFEFDFFLNQFKPHSRDLKYACDSKTTDGTEVTHSLQLELVVSKEFAPEGKPHQANPTGTGRILRMHFAVVLTELAGLGVSWDNEAPPVYEDVPPSPPGYPIEPPIEYEDLEPLDAQRGVAEPGDRRGSDSSSSSSSSD